MANVKITDDRCIQCSDNTCEIHTLSGLATDLKVLYNLSQGNSKIPDGIKLEISTLYHNFNNLSLKTLLGQRRDILPFNAVDSLPLGKALLLPAERT